MNKVIIFDLDGVLIDSKDIHFLALNKALKEISPESVISSFEHTNIYEGLPTKEKLFLLSENKGLSQEVHTLIWDLKQQYTSEMFSEVLEDSGLIEYFKHIASKEIKIGVASNSIGNTVRDCLTNLGILSFVDIAFSNESVQNPKPHPEMYWAIMSHFKTVPENVVIFEDSFVGKLAARDSGAYLIEVKNRADLTKEKIDAAIERLSKTSSFKDKKLNVLIPMAGLGSRFADAGYSFPKPLIEVNGKPMIERVVESLGIEAKYIYVAMQEHVDKYNLIFMLDNITPDSTLIGTPHLTGGAAQTCLLAKEFIDTDAPLIIANSDQIVDWDSREFMYYMHTKNADAGIATFTSKHPKWSYARVVPDTGLVLEVAEKKPISNHATVGIYYWKHGSDFVKYAQRMIDKNITVNGEFYTAPVFNEAINDGKRVYAMHVNKMWGVGTPEDLNNYLRSNND